MTPDEAFKQFKIEHPESDLMDQIRGYHVTPYGICIDLIDNTGIPYAYKKRETVKLQYDFEAFKNSMCCQLKRMGDVQFLITELTEDNVTRYYKKGWYLECLYLLSMIDYLSRKNNVEHCNKYNYLRTSKIREFVYPEDIILYTENPEEPNDIER